MAENSRSHLLRIIFSVIGILIGVSVFFVFGFNFRNWNAGLWGLFSAVPAAFTLFVHHRDKHCKWDDNPKPLKTFMLTGCFIQLAGVCGFATYLTLAITSKQGLIIHGNGFYLTCVWCFMVWKWGFLLFYFSRRYYRQHEYTALLGKEDTQTAVNSYES